MFQRLSTTLAALLFLVCCTGGAETGTGVAAAQPSASDEGTEASLRSAAIGRQTMATHAAVHQAANLTHTASEVVRQGRRVIVGAFEIDGNGSNGAPGTVQPGIGVWSALSGAGSTDRQINVPPNGNFTTAVSNAGHDAPSVVTLADGSILVPYGAASTYASYRPPAQWACMTRLFCQPFKLATREAADVANALVQSPEYLLPTSGLSELSSATLGDATILAGQQQTTSQYGQPGAQGFVTVHARGGKMYFDTSEGDWDFRSANAPKGSGLEMLTRAPNDDALFDFAIRSANGPGTISLTVNGITCSRQVNGSSPDDIASMFVTNLAAACPAFGSHFDAVRVQYDPVLAQVGPAIGIVLKRGDVASLPAALPVNVRCSENVMCGTAKGPGAVNDVRVSGLHRHGLFGGVIRAGSYAYYLMDVQQVTGSWFGAGHNSYALALACFRTSGASGPAWRWTDCSGRNEFTVLPGAPAPNRLSPHSPYVIGAPIEGYDSDMTPYIYDWSMHAQPPVGGRAYPVISAETLALHGRDLVIVHDCQLRSGGLGLCYVRYDPARGRTIKAGVVDEPAQGGSLASVALRTDAHGGLVLAALAGNGPKWGCPVGACALTYAFDERTQRWTRRDADPLGGRNDAGFVGTIREVASGFLFSLKETQAEGAARIVTFERTSP